MDASNKNILVNDHRINFLPVITLSTNTDYGRDLTRDSFAIMQFKNTSNDLTDSCVDSDSKDEKKIQINNILLKLAKESSLINNSKKSDKDEYYRLIDVFKRNTGITGGAKNNLNILIYEFILKGYPSDPRSSIKTESLSSSDENSCNYIDFDRTPISEEKDFIRSCDPINGKLKYWITHHPFTEDLEISNLEPSNNNLYDFTMNIFGNKIKSEDLIKFTNLYAAKTDTRFKIDAITSRIPSLICIYNQDSRDKIFAACKKILLNIWNFNKTPPSYKEKDTENNTLIQIINNTTIEDKFVIMGDFHGSMATFVRLLLRFRKMGILNNECILQNNYHLIFLGDIVDRGVYGYEIIMLLYCLLILNPEKVHLNRGNHEELDINTMYGLYAQIQKQFNDDTIHRFLNQVMEYQSSAILIKDPNDNKYIYLSHGSLPAIIDNTTIKLYSFRNFNDNLVISNSQFPNGINTIRWNDVDNAKKSIKGNRRDGDVVVGEDIMREAQKRNIKMSIRGHNDQLFNTKLLRVI